MRHHLDPERSRPSLSLGQSGPAPTRTDDADPGYEPPRIRGFTSAMVTPELRRALTDLRKQLGPGSPHLAPMPEPERAPLLWDGDQA